MNVVILGGTQFIGYHTALEFVRKGWNVTLVNRGLSKSHLPDS